MSNTTVQNTGAQISIGTVIKRTGIAIGLVFIGLVLGTLVGVVLGVATVATVGEPSTQTVTLLNLLSSQAGLGLAALGFLGLVAGWDFVEIRWPTTDERRLLIGGVLVAVIAETLRQTAVSLDILDAGGTVPISSEMPLWILLVVLATITILTPIIEELLFRGIVQQYLTEVATKKIGILVGTMLFVPIHGFGILLTTSSVLAAGSLLGVLTLLSVVLGVVYHRTGNLAASVIVHAGYNAIIPLVGVGTRALLAGAGISVL